MNNFKTEILCEISKINILPFLINIEQLKGLGNVKEIFSFTLYILRSKISVFQNILLEFDKNFIFERIS